MKMIFLSVVTVSVISGCTGNGNSMGRVVNDRIDFQSNLATHEFVVMKMGRLDESNITDALVDSMYSISNIPQAYRHIYREKKNKETKNYWIGGLGIDHSPRLIDITYSANSRHKLDNNTWYYETIDIDERRATFSVDITEDNKSYHVTLKCPNSYKDIDDLRGANIFEEYVNPLPQGVISNDLNNLCENSSITIGQSELVEGSFNSKFKPEDVYANFERILVANNSVTQNLSKVKTFDINKAHTFTLEQDGGSTELGINVYPYRGGSKILYAYNYRYKLTGDNKTTYNKSDMKKVRSVLIKIADD
ncbi:hypothetical protein [Vibrio sp. Hal054]|uniref:hypothetical protein n=1 Tax=Vibrio sp. Hal054 TaxID=3035158 RepID=UPI00301BE35B